MLDDGGLNNLQQSIARLVLVNWQSRMLLVVRRIDMLSAVVFAIFALWFRAWLDISKHMSLFDMDRDHKTVAHSHAHSSI
jgi:hypothetical protein